MSPIRRSILTTAFLALALAACGPGVVTPAFREAPDAVTPGESFEVRVVGFSGSLDVELCGLTVDVAQADAAGGVTVLSGVVPLLPGGTCDLVVTTAEASVTVEVDVVELLADRSVGYFVDGDGRGEFRFTAFLQGLADADLFDLTLYADFAAFVADVNANAAPEVMFFSFSDNSLSDVNWADIEAYLETGQGRAVILTYCSIGGTELATSWGLDLAINECFLNDEVAYFDLASELTPGSDAPLQLSMNEFNWSFAFTTTGVDPDVEVFCTDAADPSAVCGVYHREYPAALAGWVPEGMVGGHDDELLLQLARSLF